MIVSSATAASSANTQAATDTAKKDAIGYDAFLKLLVAQLKNQDPTKPVDSTQYVSQLATLSGLEQSVKQTAAMDRILAATSIGQGAAAIGMRATSADAQISGIVQSVTLQADGVTAKLVDGQSLPLAAGVRIEKP